MYCLWNAKNVLTVPSLAFVVFSFRCKRTFINSLETINPRYFLFFFCSYILKNTLRHYWSKHSHIYNSKLHYIVPIVFGFIWRGIFILNHLGEVRFGQWEIQSSDSGEEQSKSLIMRKFSYCENLLFFWGHLNFYLMEKLFINIFPRGLRLQTGLGLGQISCPLLSSHRIRYPGYKIW